MGGVDGWGRKVRRTCIDERFLAVSYRLG